MTTCDEKTIGTKKQRDLLDSVLIPIYGRKKKAAKYSSFLARYAYLSAFALCSCMSSYRIGTISAMVETRGVGSRAVDHLTRCDPIPELYTPIDFIVDPLIDPLIDSLLVEQGPFYIREIDSYNSSSIWARPDENRKRWNMCVDLEYSRFPPGYLIKKRSDLQNVSLGERITHRECYWPLFFLLQRPPKFSDALRNLFQKLPQGADGYVDIKLSREIFAYVFPVFTLQLGSWCSSVSGVPFRRMGE